MGTSPSGRERVLAVVLAGGAGGRLGVLTERRAKPAVPFGGMYRLIDVALSNVAHSGIEDAWVIEQYEPHALNDHLANGRPWDMDRTHGGLRILAPFQRRAHDDGEATVAGGNAEALVQHRHLLAEHGADVVVTMSADHVLRLDLRDVVSTHLDRGAGLTIVTTDVPADDDPSRFAWAYTDENGTVRGFEYKPEHPGPGRVCTEVFAFDGPTLLGELEELDGVTSAGDYGERLVPDLVARGVAVEHRLDGYWRDVGTVDAFHRAHMELLEDPPPLTLDDPSWPFLTGSIIGGPARVLPGADVHRSTLSPGVRVAGTVDESVLGRNVVVEAGAVVRRSVVLDDAVIAAGAELDGAVVDVGATIVPGDAPTAETAGVAVYGSFD